MDAGDSTVVWVSLVEGCLQIGIECAKFVVSGVSAGVKGASYTRLAPTHPAPHDLTPSSQMGRARCSTWLSIESFRHVRPSISSRRERIRADERTQKGVKNPETTSWTH
jgi:hypothetical protein